MNEKIIEFSGINPLDIFGVNDSKLDFIQSNFPKLKLIARGNSLKIKGENQEIKVFSDYFDTLIHYFESYHSLTENDLVRLLNGGYRFAGDDH